MNFLSAFSLLKKKIKRKHLIFFLCFVYTGNTKQKQMFSYFTSASKERRTSVAEKNRAAPSQASPATPGPSALNSAPETTAAAPTQAPPATPGPSAPNRAPQTTAAAPTQALPATPSPSAPNPALQTTADAPNSQPMDVDVVFIDDADDALDDALDAAAESTPPPTPAATTPPPTPAATSSSPEGKVPKNIVFIQYFE